MLFEGREKEECFGKVWVFIERFRSEFKGSRFCFGLVVIFELGLEVGIN